MLDFFKAWIMGIAIAAPVGPIGILCIRKTLELGLRGTISVGIGAALADGIYGFIAAAGLSTLSQFLLTKTEFIQFGGGLFLLYLAYYELKKHDTDFKTKITSKKMLPLATKVFFLTLSNPLTIITFLGVFAIFTDANLTIFKAFMMMLGVLLGSMTWWLILGSLISFLKQKLPDLWFQRVHYISALILGGFGILAVLSIFFK
jgi:putative LysE/RhtB family amino acid efflux pump